MTVCGGIAAQKRAEKLRAVGMPILSLEETHSITEAAVEQDIEILDPDGKREC